VELDLVSNNIMFVPGKLGKQTELAHHLHDSNKKNQSDYMPFQGGSYGKNRPTVVAKTTAQNK
jgi:hypothetical protein